MACLGGGRQRLGNGARPGPSRGLPAVAWPLGAGCRGSRTSARPHPAVVGLAPRRRARGLRASGLSRRAVEDGAPCPPPPSPPGARGWFSGARSHPWGPASVPQLGTPETRPGRFAQRGPFLAHGEPEATQSELRELGGWLLPRTRVSPGPDGSCVFNGVTSQQTGFPVCSAVLHSRKLPAQDLVLHLYMYFPCVPSAVVPPGLANAFP